jgi:hypothetical protein
MRTNLITSLTLAASMTAGLLSATTAFAEGAEVPTYLLANL